MSGPFDNGDVCLLLAPVEATSSLVRGSLFGPEAVARELEGLELFDPELGSGGERPLTIYQSILKESDRRLPGALEVLEREARAQNEAGRFVLLLGGEHTVSIAPLRAIRTRFERLGVVQLDAHGDLRESYDGRKDSHACVMRRAVDDLDVDLVGVGIRSICPEEVDFIAANPSVRHINGRQAATSPAYFTDALASLPEHVYLTIDMDAFDPTVAPGVGTPEPGGINWHQATDVIDILAKHKTIVGADVVELAPPVERDRTVRLAARVALRVLLSSQR
jgi:agmatinase